MSINALLSGASSINNSSYMYRIAQNAISQSSSMDSQLQSALQQISSRNQSETSSETTSAAYASIDTFLKTYQSELNELKETASDLNLGNSQNIFSQYKEGEAEMDDIVTAVEDFVDSYNSVTSLLKDNEGRGTGTASHLASFNRGIAAEKTLNALGITYDKEGKLSLDKEALKEALVEEYDLVEDVIGGQYGLADRASVKADQALQDSVQRIVSNDLKSLTDSTQNFSSINYTYNFNKAGVYNMTNMYVVGMFVNMTA